MPVRGSIDYTFSGEEAQASSRVLLPEMPDVVSHAGFITVNKLFNSNLFVWYFPAAFKPEDAPLLLWLQAVCCRLLTTIFRPGRLQISGGWATNLDTYGLSGHLFQIKLRKT